VSAAPAPAPFVAQQTQPLPRPSEAQPSLKVEPQWIEAVKAETPAVDAPKTEVLKSGPQVRPPVLIIIESYGPPKEEVKPAQVEPPPTPAPTPLPEPMPVDASETPKPMEPAPAPTPDIVNGYGHAEDYCWLAGEVQFSRGKGWRLRYAGFDEADQFGGSVTLMDDAKLETLQDGQMLKVRGRLVNPDGKTIAPPYKVESLEVVTP
jgi:hypothetical protein